tara:strand:+ start:184 stop:489 length:306 start_codon:yes stop_codon:yes gene_type:complete
MDQSYKIIRFFKDKPSKVIRTGLTLEQARNHCKDPKTSGDDWFDGYDISNDMNWQDQSYHWEEVPQEDLWEDGELNEYTVIEKVYQKIVREGDWKLIRRIK